jgi:hypothetical protein
MPGLSLTLIQAARLFGLTDDACRRVFDALVGDYVLRRRGDGRFILNDAP